MTRKTDLEKSIRDKVFKNEQSKICARQPFKNVFSTFMHLTEKSKKYLVVFNPNLSLQKFTAITNI